MNDLSQAFGTALSLLVGLDAQLLEIIGLSLRVSLTALLLASLVGLPLGGALAVFRFRGRAAAIVGLNAMMGLPPVVVGLLVYLVLSRSGPSLRRRSEASVIRSSSAPEIRNSGKTSRPATTLASAMYGEHRCIRPIGRARRPTR